MHDSSFRFRIVRGDGDAAVLRVGETQPMVRARVRGRLHDGIRVRISSGRMALRLGGGRLVGGGVPKMVANRKSGSIGLIKDQR